MSWGANMGRCCGHLPAILYAFPFNSSHTFLSLDPSPTLLGEGPNMKFPFSLMGVVSWGSHRLSHYFFLGSLENKLNRAKVCYFVQLVFWAMQTWGRSDFYRQVSLWPIMWLFKVNFYWLYVDTVFKLTVSFILWHLGPFLYYKSYVVSVIVFRYW